MNNNQISWRRAWRVAVGLLVALAGRLRRRPQNVVESVTSSIQGGVEVVRIDFSQPLAAVPAGFAIQAPARIALDIPGATQCDWAAPRSRSTRAISARSTWCRPANAPAWC